MARNVFYSFNFDDDAWRVSQIKNMGAVSGQPILAANEFEEIQKGGKAAIEKWIDDKMTGKSCVVVLIGRNTAGRKWVEYEFKKAWSEERALLGVHIHKLEGDNGRPTGKGANPFKGFTIDGGKTRLDSVVPVYDPVQTTSKGVYNHIETNLADWVEDAITERKKH